jgi:hypothetical protein
MNKTIENNVTSDESSVSRVAYQLWEKAGRPAGRDLEFWLAAEAQVRAAVRPAVAVRTESAPSAPVAVKESKPATRAARGGVKKSWPKPYPSLPKF